VLASADVSGTRVVSELPDAWASLQQLQVISDGLIFSKGGVPF
jgi:hypothetical protein